MINIIPLLIGGVIAFNVMFVGVTVYTSYFRIFHAVILLSHSVVILYALQQLYLLHDLFVEKNDKIDSISSIIKEAGITYLFAQLKILWVVESIIMIILWYFIGWDMSISFFMGATMSWIAGFSSMYFSVTYNKKVALSAKKGYDCAFLTAFSVGKVIGLLVSSIAFLSCYVIYSYSSLSNYNNLSNLLIGFCFGASLISVFARIGGGIFTKGADIGADLVGKIENNIPEDDPRNPAVIADALGDNIGDACGMSADLFQSFIVLVSSAILLFLQRTKAEILIRQIDIVFLVLTAGALSSMIILMSGWRFKSSDKFASLWISIKIFLIASIMVRIILGGYYLYLQHLGVLLVGEQNQLLKIIWSVICGLFSASLIMPLTEYYTSGGFSPVDGIVDASKQGSANNVIQGLSVGYQAVFLNLILVVINLWISSSVLGIEGIAFSCLGMISVCAVILALDAFGPVTDNAGSLVEMGELDSKVREVTDRLDAIGNMTKATTKGYAVFTAGITAFVLNNVFSKDLFLRFTDYDWDVSLDNIYVVLGFFIGAAVISIFVSFCLVSVNKASMAIMTEVRRQFKTLKIMEGKDKPDYNQAVEILTHASLREMVVPSLLPVISVILLFLVIKGIDNAFLAVAGFIMGITMVGIVFAISMTVSGGAWDNAKKYIEANGKKHSLEHQSAVIGDTVGDPYKDTAGPAINPVIKLIGIIALLLIKVYS